MVKNNFIGCTTVYVCRIRKTPTDKRFIGEKNDIMNIHG